MNEGNAKLSWKCDHNQALETSTYELENGIIIIVDHKLHRIYTTRNGESVDEAISSLGLDPDSWINFLIGRSKL